MEDATTGKDRGRQKRFAFFFEMVAERMRGQWHLEIERMADDRSGEQTNARGETYTSRYRTAYYANFQLVQMPHCASSEITWTKGEVIDRMSPLIMTALQEQRKSTTGSQTILSPIGFHKRPGICSQVLTTVDNLISVNPCTQVPNRYSIVGLSLEGP